MLRCGTTMLASNSILFINIDLIKTMQYKQSPHATIALPHQQGRRFVAVLLLFALLLQSCNGATGLAMQREDGGAPSLSRVQAPIAEIPNREKKEATPTAAQPHKASIRPLVASSSGGKKKQGARFKLRPVGGSWPARTTPKPLALTSS